MKKLASLTLAVAAMSAATIADANAWTRDANLHEWRGLASVHASGSCGNRGCSRQITLTGPNGKSVTRKGSASCADGTCTGTRTATGPQGGTVTHGGTVSLQ